MTPRWFFLNFFDMPLANPFFQFVSRLKIGAKKLFNPDFFNLATFI